MAGKWKRRAKEQAQTIDCLHQQIDGLLAYERTLQQHLEIAERDMQQAVAWAERSEKEVARLTALIDGCGVEVEHVQDNRATTAICSNPKPCLIHNDGDD